MEEPVTKNEEVEVEDEGDMEDLDTGDLGVEDAVKSDAVGESEEPTDEPLDVADQEDVVVEELDAPGDQDARLNALRGEYDRLNDRHLRLQAEFTNFRRRSEQERLSAWSRAQADLLEKFLDVLDDLHRVAELDLSNATVEAIMEGIDLVEKKFVRMLVESSVDMIDPTGQAFDPEMMEAMMRVPAESDGQVDTVAQVFQKGYSLKGILVRPARVSVYTQG